MTRPFTVAVPCRTDEPELAALLERVARAWHTATTEPVRLIVCVNGAGDAGAVDAALTRWSAGAGVRMLRVDLDRAESVRVEAAGVWVLRTRAAGKARAWNHLRHAVGTPGVVFLDADVEFAPDAFGNLLAALDAAPTAAIASARTQCAPRDGWLEAAQAMPYRMPFLSLSPQLYAARTDRLPPAMPVELLEPERWLELMVGRSGLVRAPATDVIVRLPGTLGDFFKQRIRIELAKVQLREAYAGLGERAVPAPGVAAAWRRLDWGERGRLAVYALLRTVARVVAEWRYRRGRTDVAWRQAASTKRWSAP